MSIGRRRPPVKGDDGFFYDRLCPLPHPYTPVN
jgi:hypothetical protein